MPDGPTINISGQTPSPTGGGNPPRTAADFQKAWDRAVQQRDAVNKTAQAQQSRTTSSTADSDYDKAIRQRTAQINTENRQWAQQQAREARLQAQRDRSLQQEIRANDARLRQDAAFQQRFKTLESRARQPLSPSGWHTTQRAIDNLRFASRGVLPGHLFERLSQSTGTEGSAFKVAQILRQGNMGQGAQIRGGLGGNYLAGKIEGELRRIEVTLEKQLRAETSPSARAAIQRQQDAIYTAKARLAAGGSSGGLGGLIQGAGAFMGGRFGAMLGTAGVAGAAVGVAADAAFQIAKLPYRANQTLASAYGAGQPYRDFLISQRRLGAAGGFAGSDLEGLTFNHSNVPGQGLPGELRAFGLSPMDVTKYAGAYGVPQRSARGTLDIAEQVRTAAFAPGMGLGEETVARLGGQARSMTFGHFDNNQYFTQLQKIMSLATSQGLDSSRLASSWSGFLQNAAQSSLSVNTGSLADWFTRMTGGGSPAMRSGEGQQSLMQGFNTTMANLGTSSAMPANVVMSSFLRHNGSPQSEEGLRKAFGMSKADWNSLVSTPQGQRALQNYIGASKAGNSPIAYQALGALISGHPELEEKIISGAGFGGTWYAADTIRNNVFGGGYQNQLAVGSTLAGQGASLGGMGPMVPSDLYPLIAKRAQELGIPINEALGVISKESGFKNIAPWKGHNAAGLGQVMPDTAREMGYSPSDMMDPEKNIDASLKYYKAQRDATNGNAAAAYERYHWGPNSGTYDTADAATFNARVGQYSNQADAQLAQGRTAEGQTAGLSASRYADANLSPVVDSVVASLSKVAGAGDEAVAMFQRLTAAGNAHAATIGATQRMPGFSRPDGSFMPLNAVPGGGAVK